MKKPIDIACEKLGGTQKTAEALGVTFQTVHQWRNGERSVPVLRAKRLGELCDYSPSPAELAPEFAELFNNGLS